MFYFSKVLSLDDWSPLNEVTNMINACAICNTTEEELRPYGVNASYICFDCMISDKDREAEAVKQFTSQLQAADRGPDSVIVIGEETGPRPMVKGGN
jgi:hypothetical protein